jgi:transposase InsO family protein
MHAAERMSLEQMQALLAASGEVEFAACNRVETYGWISRVLVGQEYLCAGREAKGLVRRYICKMTGLSRAQVTRLIGQHAELGQVRARSYRRNRFTRKYLAEDVELLAMVDEAHETLSGPATVKILQRAIYDYGDRRFERLATISVAHLYNLRKSRSYRERRVRFEKTRPVRVAIGERRRPDPQGRPGFLRVDSVHQGDLDGVKGIYHINAVDEVTQWEIVGATAQISEAWLLPVLEAMLEQFPFHIRGFHSDNGSEYINHTVATLLEKLLVEQTKSRPRRSNDNGLVEAKNGAVIRKHIGYGHICSAHAEAFQDFYRDHFNPYLNFHRPCGHAEIKQDAKGKRKRFYPWYATPWEMLRQLPGIASYLKDGVTIDDLNGMAQSQSDTQAAAVMQNAKRELFASLYRKKTA